ncbi:TPA: hypothetical protein ACPUTF_004898 [Klebsiella pneumoniae]
MQKTHKHLTKIVTISLSLAFAVLVVHGVLTSPPNHDTEAPDVKATVTQVPLKPAEPEMVNVINRIHTPEEVYRRFQDNEFRATNHFRTCRLMVTGRVKNIGTATFTKDPLVTIAIPGSDEGMKFIFEYTSSNWNEVAALEIDDILTISGMDTRKGQFGGLFLSNAEIMNTLHSRNSREMMVERNGFYDRILCEKRAIQADISDYN